jgi:integrase
MLARRRLSDKGVAALKPRAARYAHPDPECIGHYVRVMPSGAKSFAAVARDPSGKQVWTTIGPVDHLSIDDARAQAKEIIKRVKAGMTAVEPTPDSFQAVAENWLQRHVKAKGLRSAGEVERVLRKHVFTAWADREFNSIRRKDVAELLDHIEDKHGSRMADLVLAYVRSICNWYSTRDDEYVSPVVRGMHRHGKGSRSRILTDDELRAVWLAAEADAGQFGAVVRLALLTAQRVAKIQTLRWSDIAIDGIWTIASEPREKGNAGSLPLPDVALDIIRAQPRIDSSPYVFPGRIDGVYSMHSRKKAEFDRRCGITGWTVHDLRRTSRSLMARAGVRPDIAERVLGHAMGKIEGTYDRHLYTAEKGHALATLASLIGTIVHPPAEKVVSLRGRSA